MKKNFFKIFILFALFSCKKNKESISCEVSVAGITGNYKLTKVIIQMPGVPDQDVTSSVSSDCQRNGVYELKSDKTVVYTESGSCSNSGTGDWDVVDGKLTVYTDGGSFDFASKSISGWDCTSLTLSEDVGGATMKYTLTKQ